MRPETQFVTRLDCCQYLLVNQINCRLTNFAEHSEKFSRDALNRYLAPELDQFWILDCRIYSPESGGKTKLGHVQDMPLSCVQQRRLQFFAVLTDSWHAAKDNMLSSIDTYGKVFFCPLKCDRNVDDSGGSLPYRHVDSLDWTETERQQGKTVEIRNFPMNYKVKLFLAELFAKRTEYVVTNDMTQDITQVVQKVCALRWKVGQASPGN